MRARLTVVFLFCLFIPTLALAGPIRLNFSGTWSFFDPQFDNPDFWNAMNASGVFQNSPLSLSLFVNDVDTDPDPNINTYQVSGGQVTVGNVNLAVQPGNLTFSFSQMLMIAQLSGPAAQSYFPSFFQFGNSSVQGFHPPTGLSSAMAGLQTIPSYMFVGYRSPVCGLCLGTSAPVLTSVQAVPEPSALIVIITGIASLFVFNGRRRLALRRVPAPRN